LLVAEIGEYYYLWECVVMDSSVATTDAKEIKPKMKFNGKVVKTSLAGAVIEIGVDKPAVLHVSQVLAPKGTEAARVEDVLEVGQEIEVWIRRVKEDHIELTMIKPLDLEWRDIKKDMVVKGTVVRIEKFGAFVEIGAERPGLVHISEMGHGYVKTPNDVVKEGDEIEAMVLEVNRRKKQIKLSMKALQPEPEHEEKPAPKASRKPRKGAKPQKDYSEFLVDENEEEVPTAFAMAYQQALEKAQGSDDEGKSKKAKSVSKTQDDILARTLENKIKAS
jgi:ribosomal protein S1